MKIIDEFKTFAIKGNVVDMAVGIIIGSAFNKIVTSLVEDVILPPIGYISGGINFADFKIVLKSAVTDAHGKVIHEAVSMNYGNFIQILVNFVIIAFSMFMVVKLMNKIRERQEKKYRKAGREEEKPALSRQEQLLTEIRDALRKQSSA